jgi:hypothetical protein
MGREPNLIDLLQHFTRQELDTIRGYLVWLYGRTLETTVPMVVAK